jgi:tRNA(Ile)-lysidine synthase
LRELAAAASPPLRLEAGSCVWWDRRFAATLPASAAAAAATGLFLGYAGAAAAAVPTDGGLPRRVRPVLTALWDQEGLAAVPHLGYRRDGVVGVPPSLFFHPVNPLAQPGFTVV